MRIFDAPVAVPGCRVEDCELHRSSFAELADPLATLEQKGEHRGFKAPCTFVLRILWCDLDEHARIEVAASVMTQHHVTRLDKQNESFSGGRLSGDGVFAIDDEYIAARQEGKATIDETGVLPELHLSEGLEI